jgi:DNA mismatch endonuclease, patch repair protein
MSSERRSWNMGRVRGKDTTPELVVRRLAHRLGLRFRLHASNLPGRPDLVLPKYKVAIFVHGCFWHRHEGCRRTTIPATRREFWLTKFSDTVKRDRRNETALQDLGWNVLVVWECEVKKLDELATRLEQLTTSMK